MGEQERKSTGEKRAGELKRRSRRKAQKRKALLKKRILMAVIGAAAVAMIIWGISALISSIGKGGSKKVSSDGVVLAQMNASQVVHLSFSMLSIDPKDGRVSAEQFQEILEWLYDKGYCLMDVYELAYVDEDGNYSYKETFDFPEGKIPLILSERDVCYPFNSAEEGVADRMLVEDGKITCQRTLENTKKETGKYDIVPIVESFINKHPDFSYNGARGVLGFTGYCGVLGYRTSPYLGKNADNPYAAAYGTFDTELEKENAQAVLEKLKDLGWRFASCGYAQDIS